jgi:hypothetical protein
VSISECLHRNLMSYIIFSDVGTEYTIAFCNIPVNKIDVITVSFLSCYFSTLFSMVCAFVFVFCFGFRYFHPRMENKMILSKTFLQITGNNI